LFSHFRSWTDDAAAVAEIFEWIDPEPLASASIAQVHRARLRHQSQREVVIKIQHDGVGTISAPFSAISLLAFFGRCAHIFRGKCQMR